MADKKNVIKFRTRREVNIGLVVAFGVLVLLVIHIYRYFTTPHLSVYEVLEGSAKGEVPAVAMILREETVYTTDEAGYLNYYYREGARVAKDTKVYSLNDTSDLQNLLQLNEENPVLNTNDIVRLKNDIRSFTANYTDTSFGEAYSLHEDILSDYLRYRDLSLLDAISGGLPDGSAFHTVYAKESGTLTYFSDRYDGYTRASLKGDEFEPDNLVVPERSKPTGISAIESFAYKLVTEEDWELVIKLDDESLKRLQNENGKVKFKISGDSTIYEKEYELLTLNGGYYICVAMDRYGNDYLTQRFLDITIYFSMEEGLKIPKTAILEKEMYQIPERFVGHGGGEEDNLGVVMEYFDEESGSIKPDFKEITPLFKENGYYFVAKEDMDADRYINSMGLAEETERAMLYSFLTKKEGVYNMNKGYAVFKRIERLTDLEDYILVKGGLPGGVALYDHIVLDVSAVTKDVILIEGE